MELKEKLLKDKAEREAMYRDAATIASQIMTVFSENKVTIRQAKLALEQTERMLSNVTIQSTSFTNEKSN